MWRGAGGSRRVRAGATTIVGETSLRLSVIEGGRATEQVRSEPLLTASLLLCGPHRVLRHTLQYTPLIADEARPSFLAHAHGPQLFSLLHPDPASPASFVLSQLGALLVGDITFSVPVYVVYGPTEDVRVLEKFRTGEYAVKNLMVVDEAATRLLDVGGVKLRLLGLGGSLQMSKICGSRIGWARARTSAPVLIAVCTVDNGEGVGTIAGGNGMVWATALQIGELVDTAQRVGLAEA